MAVGIGGQIYFSLQVDGVEVPLPMAPQLKVLINVNCKNSLPVVKLDIPDAANAFAKKIPLNDGSVLNVRLNDDNQEAYPGYTTLRAMGTPLRHPAQQFMQYSVNAILDALPYVRANPSSHFVGSSVDVMQQVAKTLNFNYQGSLTTNDVMSWLPGRHTWSKFAQHLSLHGWIDDKAAIAPPAVNEQRDIHHVNINDLFANGKIKANIFYGSNPSGETASLSNSIPSFPATQYRSINRSGMLNNLHGYGLRLAQNSVAGVVNSFDKILAQTVNNVLDMSKEVAAQIGKRARIDIPAFDTGNTHDNYLRAKHQNLRNHSIYSQNVYVLVPYTTALTVYDMVHLDINSNDYTDPSSTGIYAVTAMTRALIGSRYYEKIELTSAGPENENSSLIGQSGLSDAARQKGFADAAAGPVGTTVTISPSD